MYFVYVFGIFLARVLPKKVSYWIAGIVARLYFRFAHEDRKALGYNFKAVIGEQIEKEALNRHIYLVFKNFGKYLIDFFRFPGLSKEYLYKNIKLENIENLDKTLKEGKGAILVTLHLGNWELGGVILTALKYKISAIVLEHPSKRINDFFTRHRGVHGLRSIPIGPKIKECFRVLKRNEVLAIVGDKDYTNTGVMSSLFGRKAIIPRGPALFSLKTGAPIVFTVVAREKDDTYKMYFEEPISHVSTGDEEKDILSIINRYMSLAEKYIRKYPDQWYSFRDIWDQGSAIL